MEKTLFEEISDAYPGMSNTQIRSTLAAFLFTGDDVFKRIGDLSGGERGRVSLAKLMLSEANFLILDEPTIPPVGSTFSVPKWAFIMASCFSR